MMGMAILKAVLTLGVLGLIFGGALSVASNLFQVKEDQRKKQVLALLPGANCGGCGFAGCENLAAAIVAGDAACNQCPVNADEKVAEIAVIMGTDSAIVQRRVAHIRCHGSNEFANKKYIYYGMNDCAAANRLLGGYMTCQYGCLGFGNCVSKCPENAIFIQNGVAVVNRDSCVGCGVCLDYCPKGIIELIPRESHVFVSCSNKDQGVRTRVACNAGCIGCQICEKNCPHDAIHVVGNVSVIDYNKCVGCGICVEKCPRKIIEVIQDEQ